MLCNVWATSTSHFYSDQLQAQSMNWVVYSKSKTWRPRAPHENAEADYSIARDGASGESSSWSNDTSAANFGASIWAAWLVSASVVAGLDALLVLPAAGL